MSNKLVIGIVAAALGWGGFAPGQAPAGPGKVVLLWPNGAPAAKGTADEDKPSLTIFLPTTPNATSAINPTETGVVVAPGGGYTHLAMEKEGYAVARWLNDHGVAAFVLTYRLGPKYHYPVELEDAQRAIRMIRAHAAEYGVAADHIGMWGFSAGGHLTATAGTKFAAGKLGSADVVERQGSRPDFLVLAYPVITFEAPYAHVGSKKYLLGDTPSPALVRALSANLQVTKETPPTFLFSTTDDATVSVMNSVLFYEALVKAKVPVEMHLFQHGAHGAGLAAADPALQVWPEQVIKWMRERGYAAQSVP